MKPDTQAPAGGHNFSTHQLQTIIDAMPVAVCVSNAAGQLFSANGVFVQTFDVTLNDRWVGRTIADLNGAARFSRQHTPLTLAEHGLCTLTVFTELASQSVGCDELLIAAAHDLRTPLNAMTGWLHLLEHSANQPMADKAKSGIRRAIEHQTRVVNELSQFVQLSKGQTLLVVQKADLGQLLQELLASHNTAHNASHNTSPSTAQSTTAESSAHAVRFITDVKGSLPVSIDVELIQSVLQVTIDTFKRVCASSDCVAVAGAQVNGFANLTWRRYDRDGVQLSLGSSFGVNPHAAGASRQSLTQMRATLLLGLHRGFMTVHDEQSVNNATLDLNLPAA
jgi:His Kinase A (phospho-acceptor) domain